jgi:TonB family protein
MNTTISTSARFVLLNFFAVGALLCVPSGFAQFKNLDRMGEQMVKELKSLRLKRVAVADMTAFDGSPLGQGHYFAWILTSSLQHYGGAKLRVSNHADFDAELKRANLSAASFASPVVGDVLSGKVNVDAVVVGTVTSDKREYTVHVSALRISDDAALFTKEVFISRNGFLDSLSELFPPKTDEQFFVLKGKDSKIRPPRCIRCPVPQYNYLARRDKIQGTVLFDVLISAEGRAVSLHPVRLIGYGLDEQAFDTVKTWTFQPAATDEGVEVSVIIPIEVSFRLF